MVRWLSARLQKVLLDGNVQPVSFASHAAQVIFFDRSWTLSQSSRKVPRLEGIPSFRQVQSSQTSVSRFAFCLQTKLTLLIISIWGRLKLVFITHVSKRCFHYFIWFELIVWAMKYWSCFTVISLVFSVRVIYGTKWCRQLLLTVPRQRNGNRTRWMWDAGCLQVRRVWQPMTLVHLPLIFQPEAHRVLGSPMHPRMSTIIVLCWSICWG